MTDIKIDMSGHTQLIRNFSGAQDVIRQEMTTFVGAAALAGEAKAKELVPKKTHHLERSITAVAPAWAGGMVTAAWGTNVPYAKPVEFGSKAHVITARNKPFLHFKGSRGWVRKKSVNHPGTKKRPYMKPSYEYIRTTIPGKAETMKLRIIQRISGGGG